MHDGAVFATQGLRGEGRGGSSVALLHARDTTPRVRYLLRMFRFVPLATAALATVLLVACIHTRKTSLPPDGPRSIAYGYHTGLKGPSQRVIRTAEEWYQLWIDHHSNVVPVPLPPKVDFTREMVLCVAIGQRPTGGYGVRITRTHLEGGELHVEVHETRPPQGAIVPMVLSQPYEMVRVPRFDGAVVFDVK